MGGSQRLMSGEFRAYVCPVVLSGKAVNGSGIDICRRVFSLMFYVHSLDVGKVLSGR